MLWLKYSYPLRRLVKEVERRLIEVGSLEPGEVFFMQAPELLAATLQLPQPLDPELVRSVRNRHRAYRLESKLAEIDPSTVDDEDDYV